MRRLGTQLVRWRPPPASGRTGSCRSVLGRQGSTRPRLGLTPVPRPGGQERDWRLVMMIESDPGWRGPLSLGGSGRGPTGDPWPVCVRASAVPVCSQSSLDHRRGETSVQLPGSVNITRERQENQNSYISFLSHLHQDLLRPCLPVNRLETELVTVEVARVRCFCCDHQLCQACPRPVQIKPRLCECDQPFRAILYADINILKVKSGVKTGILICTFILS